MLKIVGDTMLIANILKNKEAVAKIVLLFIMIILLLAIIYFYNGMSKIKLDENRLIDFYFLKLDEADSTIIKYKNKVIIIDTGEEKNKEMIKNKLQKLDIKVINYMILTHPDKDHIGGAKYLIENFKVDKIIQSYFNKDSSLQKELDRLVIEKNIDNLILRKNEELIIDDMKLTFVVGNKETYNKDNDYSIVTLIDYFNQSFFFGADIEEARIEEIMAMNLKMFDVVKVPHHGRYNYLSVPLFEKLQPKYAVVTSGRLDDRVLDKLRTFNTLIYFTKYNEINIKSDGSKFRVDSW